MDSNEDVAIFWDYENCPASANITGYEIVNCIRSVAHAFGSIKLFKAYLELSDPSVHSRSSVVRSELQSSGVSLTDCPHNGRKDVADKMMLVDMLAHAIDHSPPLTIILISGDRDFAYAVSILRQRRYRVVIMSLPGIHMSLKAQASVYLDWHSDVLGIPPIDDALSAARRDPRPNTPRRGEKPLMPSTPGPRARSLHPDNDDIDASPRQRRASRSRAGSEAFLPELAQSPRMGSNAYVSSPRPSQGIDLGNDSSYSPPPVPRGHIRSDSAPAITSYSNSYSPPTPGAGHTGADGNPSASQPKTPSPPRSFPLPEESGPLIPSISPMPPSGSIDSSKGKGKAEEPAVTSIPLAPVAPKPALSPATPIVVPKPSLGPKVAPVHFRLLVQRLEYHRARGFNQPYRSGIAVELANGNPLLYKSAGVTKFSQYVTLAEKNGIVELGGTDNAAWISLRPEWYGAKTT